MINKRNLWSAETKGGEAMTRTTTTTLVDIPYPALPPRICTFGCSGDHPGPCKMGAVSRELPAVLDPARASLPAEQQKALDFALLLWRGKLCARHGLREMHRTWQRHREVLGASTGAK